MARLIIHPGEHLADELKALDMSANELAKKLGVPTNRITQIIRGKRGITGDTALRLGRWFGTGPDIWMNLQKNYELRLAEQEIGEALNNIPRHCVNMDSAGGEMSRQHPSESGWSTAKE
jgi:addiction module HigA family antidote